MQLPLVTSGCLIQKDNFWSSLLVYHDRPNIVNKKIIGVTQAFLYEVTNNKNINLKPLTSFASVIYEVRKLPEISTQHLGELIPEILRPYNKDLTLTVRDIESFKASNKGVFISLRILHPKIACEKHVEVVILNKNNDAATFYAVGEKTDNMVAPPFAYTVELNANRLRITVDDVEDADTSSANWLVEKLFPKLVKWTEDAGVVFGPSLCLVEVDRYASLYRDMKAKYGKKFVDSWKENTDPLKFVYEDIAIAAYLIGLWEKTSPHGKPTFVDLGCGNGLLVYILNQEGFDGYGIDVRKRKIWDSYPDSTNLQVKTIIPSKSSLFPDADWIIGNHSDELTPWIPVIASRSSPKTNIFLLPCCSYEFNGRKYARLDSSQSQYNEYLNYVREICCKCGLVVRVDKLRIPSTKKTCIVSFGRSYGIDEHDRIDKELTGYINERSKSKVGDVNLWIGNFEPRERSEPVRNCTRLNRDFIDGLLRSILRQLLDVENYLEKCDGKRWNAGKSLLVGDVAAALPREALQEMKKECGGVQTLLRNHRYIFEVVAGSVKLRVPVTLAESCKYKSKPCWFVKNHPDGCLHDAYTCMYGH